MNNEVILKIEGLSKSFPGVKALKVKDISKKSVINNVSFTAFSDEVLGITGVSQKEIMQTILEE
ncbi:hypothetical protein ES705_01256 [subsurface metagenome]|nr:hypothetical protein [Clostridia bacterium]